MLTAKRFKKLVDSYGADLERWPEENRYDARALQKASAEARQLLSEARQLDQAIEATSKREGARIRFPGGPRAAVARLRAGVAARIASNPNRRRFRWSFAGEALSLSRRVSTIDFSRAAIATTGGVSALAGLLTGLLFETVPEPANLFTLLQPAPFQILVD